MSGTALINSYKRKMTLSGLMLIVEEENLYTGEPLHVKWSLERKYETNMSTVYLATSVNEEKTILKRIPSSNLSMQELDALINLNASGYKHLFVSFHRWFELEDQVYCMMEYFPLGDLTAFRLGHVPTESEIRMIALQILLALKAMHGLGYAHRDIKPSNILVARKSPPQVKVCDFGISKRMLDGGASFLNTGSYTISYAAPEVLGFHTSKVNDRVNNKVDLWALGCVLAELILGEAVFPHVGAIANFCFTVASQDQLRERLVQSRNISQTGVDFIMKLLKADSAQRPSAEEALGWSWISDRSRDSQQHAIPFMQGSSSAYDGSLRQFVGAPPRGEINDAATIRPAPPAPPPRRQFIPRENPNEPATRIPDPAVPVHPDYTFSVDYTTKSTQSPSPGISRRPTKQDIHDRHKKELTAKGYNCSSPEELNKSLSTALQKDLEDMKKLVELGADPINKISMGDGFVGLTPMTIVVAQVDRVDPKKIEYLVSKGVDPNWRDDGFMDDSLLHILAQYTDDSDAVDALLRAGADPSVKNRLENLPLHIATQYGRSRILESLLNAAPGLIDRTGIGGQTALHFAVGFAKGSAMDREHLEVFKILIEHGANPHILDDRRKSVKEYVMSLLQEKPRLREEMLECLGSVGVY